MSETDIHDTDRSQFPHVKDIVRVKGDEQALRLALNFKPTAEQLRTLRDHLLTWHP